MAVAVCTHTPQSDTGHSKVGAWNRIFWIEVLGEISPAFVVLVVLQVVGREGGQLHRVKGVLFSQDTGTEKNTHLHTHMCMSTYTYMCIYPYTQTHTKEKKSIVCTHRGTRNKKPNVHSNSSTVKHTRHGRNSS